MTSDGQNTTRTEKDSLGTKQIPANVYYGIQTARAVENYPISGMRAHPTLIRAFGMVKKAAAEANRSRGIGIANSSWMSSRPAPASAST